MNKDIMRQAGLGNLVDLVERGLCPSCRQPVGIFNDALSRKEFGISGLCQKCQDRIFAGHGHGDNEFDDCCDLGNPNGHPDKIKGNKL